MAVKILPLFVHGQASWHGLDQEEPESSHRRGVPPVFTASWMGPHSISTLSARVLWLQRERKRELRACAGLIYTVLKRQGKYNRGKTHLGFRAVLSYGKHERYAIYVSYLLFRRLIKQPSFVYKRTILAPEASSPGK